MQQEKSNRQFWGAIVLTAAIIIGLGGLVAKAAIESGVLIYGQDYTKSTSKDAPLRLGAGADNSVNTSVKKLAVLPCRANAAVPSWTEGNNVPCSTDLSGNIRLSNAFAGGLGSGATGGVATGISVADSYATISISSATTTLIVTGVSGRHIRIASQHMVASAAENVAWLSGTGATCGTGTAAVAGGTTAASGYNFAANGGIAQGSGLGMILRTVAAGDSLCLITSSTAQLSGGVSYAIW